MGTTGYLLLTLLPIAAVLVLLVVLKKSATFSGLVGWALIAAVAVAFFRTTPEVVIRSTLAGMVKSFPVSLIVAASLLQMAYMEKSGALKRAIIFIKTIASENQAVQIIIINVSFGTLMVAVGATPVSLLPPIMVAMGYSTYAAIALPAIGYDSLCTYALLGAPVVVFYDIANGFLVQNQIVAKGHEISLSQIGGIFFLFLPIVSTMIGLAMLWIVGKWKAVKSGWFPCLLTGGVIALVAFFTNRHENFVTLTGVLCGSAIIVAQALVLRLSGRKIIDRSRLTAEERDYERRYPLWKALSPWILLIVLILALNVPKDVFNALYKELTFPITGLSANLKDAIKTRFLWNAYTWIVVSTLLSMLFIRPSRAQVRESLKVWGRRAPKPVLSAAVFFAIGEVMNMSGFSMAGQDYAVKSMVRVLADGSSALFKGAYGGVVAFIGLFGGFLTGSEASTIAMFGKYTMSTAHNLDWGVAGIILATAGLAFGAGLASVISPAKLQNAAASIDRLGEESKVIRVAFVFSLIFTAVTTLFLLLFLSLGLRV